MSGLRSRTKNLKGNPAEHAEIVFIDKRRRAEQPPPPLPDIERVSTMKILGVTFTNSLSAIEHVLHTVVSSRAQILYALRTLHAH